MGKIDMSDLNNEKNVNVFKKAVTFEEFQEINEMCRLDIKEISYSLVSKIQRQAIMSDIAKKSKEKELYKEFLIAISQNKDTNIYQFENLLKNTNINILDIMEVLVNFTYFNKFKNDTNKEVEIPYETLKLALNNTVKLIEEIIIDNPEINISK